MKKCKECVHFIMEHLRDDLNHKQVGLGMCAEPGLNNTLRAHLYRGLSVTPESSCNNFEQADGHWSTK
jgi:hypothetical protein